MRHVTRTNASRHTNERVTSHTGHINELSCINESYHTWMSHVTYE